MVQLDGVVSMLFLLAFLATAAEPEPGPAPGCEPLPPLDLAMGLDLADGLSRDGQVEAYREVVTALEADIECADFEVDSERLGRLLWHLAATRYPEEGWQGPLATLVRVEPRTERPVSPTHPLYRWVPGSTPANTPVYEVRSGARIVVDGTARLKYFELPPDGAHLVQYWHDEELSTILLPAGEPLAGSGPVWRYVSRDEQRRRRARARKITLGVAGGFAVAGVVGGVVANRSTAAVFNNPSSERERLLKQRNAGRVLAVSGAAGALLSIGAGMGVKW